MTPPLQSVPPADGVLHGVRSSTAPWTGEKRLKTVGPPSFRFGLSSSSVDATEDFGRLVKERPSEQPVFSAEDDIAYEESSRCYKELVWRECFFYVDRKRYTWDDRDDVYERLCLLRYKDCKILMEDGVSNPAREQLLSQYPPDCCPWDSIYEPGPSIFGWTYDPEYFDIVGLDDYQRILPTRANFDEYHNWEKYRSTFSNYKTDLEYVKYCDEISKKMKWVEECMRLDYKKFADKFEYRARKQSVMIAIGYPHLTADLAKRGFDEYVLDLLYDLDTKDYVRVYFEVWERVYKQEMSFEDALKLSLPAFHYSCDSMIRRQFLGYSNLMHDEFAICMDRIPSHVVENDKVFELINDAVYKMKSVGRPKKYLDFVKKKLEVAQRLQLSVGDGLFRIGKD